MYDDESNYVSNDVSADYANCFDDDSDSDVVPVDSVSDNTVAIKSGTDISQGVVSVDNSININSNLFLIAFLNLIW